MTRPNFHTVSNESTSSAVMQGHQVVPDTAEVNAFAWSNGYVHQRRQLERTEARSLAQQRVRGLGQFTAVAGMCLRTMSRDGFAAESLQLSEASPFEFTFQGSAHLLVLASDANRQSTIEIDGQKHSGNESHGRRLTFVPAGRCYKASYGPARTLGLAYFYFDPSVFPLGNARELRLYFESTAVVQTTAKLRKVVQAHQVDSADYFEVLCMVLSEELRQVLLKKDVSREISTGGLAAWQERRVKTYIEENLRSAISLSTLARLVELSPHYFCRAFRQTVGVPPLRYQNSLRIARAKRLLQDPRQSITDIGFEVGFSESSAFSAAFHKWTGRSPSSYRREACEL